MLTFNQVLDQYRQRAFSERDKGTRFEKLMQGFMQTYPAYRGRFAKVWLWNEFPFRGDFGGKDTGIDLVAKTVEGDYWAVQCKCYQEKSRIDKPAVDSFLSTSSKTFADEQGQIHSFAQRLWISTTNNWNSEAENTIKNQNPPVARISLTDLQTEAIDWEKLNNGIFGEGAIKKDRQPRDHQKKAMKLAAEHYAQNTRGKMIMACGTGKTFTSLKIVEQQTDGHGLILFLVPSIALLGQTLNEWSTFAKKPLNAICVCSDATASNRKKDDNDELKSVDLALPATTDVAKIAQRLREAMRLSKAKPEETGMTVVFSTYQSIEVVAKAQKKILAMSTPEEKDSFIFDYIICDEAHRTTGVEDKTKGESPFLMVHKDENVQGRHRLYMTATPRLYTADSKKKAADGGVEICSMDDPDIYGEEFYRIGFGEAVEKDLLADYKVLVLTIGDDQIPARLQEAIADPKQQIQTDDASKLIGCINALSKRMVGDDDYLKEVDPQPMHTALA
ncbi:MAG: DEAD/DEAH box helicase family protein, partial [Selenomonas sp.]|nr:DEAD/DEAH box helicase family protein [Selenomonas sp.]